MRIRRLTTVVVAVASVLACAGTPAGAEVDPPSQWPTPAGLGTTAHTMRLVGGDRFATNLTAELVLRSCADSHYPFDTADRTSSNASSLESAHGWFGGGDCDFHAIVVTAGDRFADALAASALSDPAHQGESPILRNVETGADEPVGTQNAPVLVTASTRQGATGLSSSALAAAQDAIAASILVESAIIVGGPDAVPVGVEQELRALGYRVYRVGGSDRYDTARLIAMAVGLPSQPTGPACSDDNALDGTTDTAYRGKGTLEYRADGATCTVLSQTVVLADGLTGADALAAGWFTSLFRIPILLTGPGGSLPPATAEALASLDVGNLVVLGGVARIPDETVAAAAATAAIPSERVLRVAGADRYETSVLLARYFGGFHLDGAGPDDFDGDTFCIAASSGEGDAAQGWPDAIAAGPFCGQLSGEGDGDLVSPRRALPPTNGGPARLAGGHDQPSHDLTPVLLVPPGAPSLPQSTAGLLGGAFDPAGLWCTSEAQVPEDCLEPGFAMIFGGRAAVSDGIEDEIAFLVSGGRYVTDGDQAPTLAPGFFTSLPMLNHGLVGETGTQRVCFERNALRDVRWLAVYDDPGRTEFDAEGDVMGSGYYRADFGLPAGQARSPGLSAPVCVNFADDATGQQSPDDASSSIVGVSLSGHVTPVQTFDYGPAGRLTLSSPISQLDPEQSSGPAATTDDSGGGTTTWAWDSPIPDVTLHAPNPVPVNAALLTITVGRGTDLPGVSGPDVVTGTFTLVTSQGTVEGVITAEGRLEQGVWVISGHAEYPGGTFGVAGGDGGFSATIETAGTPTNSDDDVTWSVDGLLFPATVSG